MSVSRHVAAIVEVAAIALPLRIAIVGLKRLLQAGLVALSHYLRALTLCRPVHLRRAARARTLKWSGAFARRNKLVEGKFSSWTKRHYAPPEGM